MDPQAPETLWAATGWWDHNEGDICRCDDGGKSWLRLNKGDDFYDVKQLVSDPHNFSILFAATREQYDQKTQRLYPGGAFRSDDAGKTWRQILSHQFVHGIAVSPANAQVLYVTTLDHPYHDGAVAEGVLKSTDGGKTWQHENTGLSHHNLKGIAISPHDSSRLFISTSGNSVFTGKDGAIRAGSREDARARSKQQEAAQR